MTVFGLESTDIAFLGLILSVIAVVVIPLVRTLLKISNNVMILLNYVNEHEDKSKKADEKLDRVSTDMAVVKNRVRQLESKVFKRNGAVFEREEENGD